MRSGLMRNLIDFQRSSEIRDAFNQPGVSWETVYSNVRADKKQKRGQQVDENSGSYTRVIWTFRTWYLPEVTTNWRIVENGVVFEIINPLEANNRQNEMIWEAKEIGRV